MCHFPRYDFRAGQLVKRLTTSSEYKKTNNSDMKQYLINDLDKKF